jgi:acetoin utilization protein AcuB
VFSNSGLKQEGGIIVLEMNAHNYSLAEISRITEVNDTKIIGVLVQPFNDGNNTLFVSLKFNKPDLKFVISTFERFSYHIVYARTSGNRDSSMEDRFNWLIKFINS